MIIYIPEFTKKESSCIISARFELDKPVPYVPEKLWYSFPEEYAPLLNTRSDAFAPVGLLAAMYTGEDLEVQGPISPLLAANLLKYRDLYHEWWPDLFKMVEISFDQLVPPEQGPGKPMVMTAFSGGVDSFYSLWENLPDRQPDPEKQITHGLFIEGIDLYMDDRENFESVYEQYASMFADLGLDLLRAATNARKFLELRVNWTRIFGAATISIAHLFSNQLRRFYFPSDVAVSWVDNIHGSSPLTDPLLSSEVLEIVHQGILPGRGEKIRELAKWPQTHHKLRVCADKNRMQGMQNCSHCDKCFRTMTLLELEGASELYNNFSHPMRLQDYLHWGLRTPINLVLARDILQQARQAGNVKMAAGMRIAILTGCMQLWLNRTIKKLLGPGLTYRIKRVVFKAEKDNNHS